ncbi:MAG TPA: AraC family transcriptional regulator [Planctomycetota bacterium]|nr:AraC family transcriptional regulator [Planctomycetota bacterium]
MRVIPASEVFARPDSPYGMHEMGSDGDWRYAEHGHDGFGEVLYVLAGAIDNHVNGGVRRLRSGELTVIRQGDRHALRGSGFRFCNVNVPAATWRALGGYLGAPTMQRLLKPADPPVRAVPEGERPAFEQRLGALFAAQDSPQADALLRRFLVDAVVGLIAGPSTSARAAVPPADGPAWLVDLLAEVDDRRLATMGAATLARLAGKSHEHLARTFRAHVGDTPTRWLHRLRLERAALRLSHTNHAIVDIALALGFANLGYFYRLFKRRFGMPPHAYRRLHAPAALRA